MAMSSSNRLQQIDAQEALLADEFRKRIEDAIGRWNGRGGLPVFAPRGILKETEDQVIAEYTTPGQNWDVKYRTDVPQDGPFYQFSPTPR